MLICSYEATKLCITYAKLEEGLANSGWHARLNYIMCSRRVHARNHCVPTAELRVCARKRPLVFGLPEGDCEVPKGLAYYLK